MIPLKGCVLELLGLQRQYKVNLVPSGSLFMIVESSYCDNTGNLVRQSHVIPGIITDLVHRLSLDPSYEVQSFVVDLTTRQQSATESDGSPTNARCSPKRLTQLATFSRPPRISAGIDRPLRLVEEWSFSGGDSRSLHAYNLDGNASLISEDMSHTGGLQPPSLCVNGVYNRDERFDNTRERVPYSIT